MTIVEMHVNMDCHGCEENIRKALNKLEGVHDVHVDFDMQKVTVAGFVDERKVLKAVKKTGKTAQIWQHQPPNFYYNNFDQYHQYDQMNYGHSSSWNSYYARPAHVTRHYKHGKFFGKTSYEVYHYQPPYSQMVKETPITMFSDDDVHSCSIM
ncbi:HMA domain-containing protein [Psidium guajava]|nr:HMA domain-containing protein [Psidium guajava]